MMRRITLTHNREIEMENHACIKTHFVLLAVLGRRFIFNLVLLTISKVKSEKMIYILYQIDADLQPSLSKRSELQGKVQ